MKNAILALLVLAAIAAPKISLAGETTQATKIGADRSGEQSMLYVPTNYSDKKTWPLIVLLHGYSGDEQVMDDWFGFKDQAQARGFILISAEGLKDSHGLRYWNATDGCCDFDHRKNDDVAYLKGLITDTQVKFNIDPKRIYIAGHSNGGFMAHRLACEMSTTIAAIVSFAGDTWLNDSICHPQRPVSVLQIQALDDDTINYNGDLKGYPGLAGYPGSPESVRRWAGYDGCKTVSVKTKIDITASISGKDATPAQYGECADGTTVELWTIDAHKAAMYSPHIPLLNDAFTKRVLNFLLQQYQQ